MKKLLIIDDESMIVDVAKVIFKDLGYQVDGYTDPVAGEEQAIKEDYDLILVDLRMPKRNGAQVAQGILKAKPDAKVLVITAYPTDPLAKQAMDAGVKTLLKKPFEIAKIIDFLKD